MNPRLFFWTWGLVVALSASACASNANQQPDVTVATVSVATQKPVSLTEIQQPAPLTEVVPTLQAIATSRGPNLEATDPTTVSLASGGFQLVEFFEFW